MNSCNCGRELTSRFEKTRARRGAVLCGNQLHDRQAAKPNLSREGREEFQHLRQKSSVDKRRKHKPRTDFPERAVCRLDSASTSLRLFGFSVRVRLRSPASAGDACLCYDGASSVFCGDDRLACRPCMNLRDAKSRLVVELGWRHRGRVSTPFTMLLNKDS